MNAWFDDFAALCVEIASSHGTVIDPPALDPAVARELLELTRVVARGSERQYAPLAAFLAGSAIDRVARARPNLSSDEAVAFLGQLREALERK